MERPNTTKEVAAILGVSVSTILLAIRTGRIPEPEKHGAAFVWGRNEIEAARAVLFLKQTQGAPR